MTIEIHKPELERLIRERVASEGRDVEDVLLEALQRSGESVGEKRKGKKRLGQFPLESPLRDSGPRLERQREYLRQVEL